MSRRLLLAALVVLAALAAALAPVSGPAPWQEELADSVWSELSASGAATSPGGARAALALVDPEGLLARWVQIDESCLSVRPSDESAPLCIPWRPRPSPSPSPAPPHADRPLAGMRILLDPGHHGAAWSELEKRHFVQGGSEPVREGDLNWAVARLLEARLRTLGAEVRLTRGAPPPEPPPAGRMAGFDPERERATWLGTRLDAFPASVWRFLYPARLAHLALEARRREPSDEELYNAFDLRRRAAVAGEWPADVTLSIHHNASDDPRLNFLVVFVPGALLADEVGTASERYWAVRRIAEGDPTATVELARAVSRAMHSRMAMPRFSLAEYALEQGRADERRLLIDADWNVYARNLAMLRRTPGRVLLVEGPCMTNPEEHERLRQQAIDVDGRHYPERVRQYAEALTDALLESAPLLRR